VTFSSSTSALLSSFTGQPTNLAQLHHTGGGEVALLAVQQPPEPPLLLEFGQHQDDVTQKQLQLVGPVGPVAVHHYHLPVTGSVTAGLCTCDFTMTLINEVQFVLCCIDKSSDHITFHLADAFYPERLTIMLHSYTVDKATGSNSVLSVLLKDTSTRAGIEPPTP